MSSARSGGQPGAALWTALQRAGEPGLERGPRAGVAAEPALRAEVAAAVPAALPERARDLLLAAALLWHDHLDAAHALIQAREGDADADWLHAMLHRREGDLGNAGYWFGEAAGHPLEAELAGPARAAGLGDLVEDGRWRPRAGVAALRAPVARRGALAALQAEEFRLLVARLLAAPAV
jgi:hypothetical protein